MTLLWHSLPSFHIGPLQALFWSSYDLPSLASLWSSLLSLAYSQPSTGHLMTLLLLGPVQTFGQLLALLWSMPLHLSSGHFSDPLLLAFFWPSISSSHVLTFLLGLLQALYSSSSLLLLSSFWTSIYNPTSLDISIYDCPMAHAEPSNFSLLGQFRPFFSHSTLHAMLLTLRM
ncbi:hypothetical protein DL96DRAFT_1724723 [Flagelloscypha sp. PMI_526]|nr:hypothetical protein DL96DRAFT_1724723 [Flagelloscypha sp. PMI_526]